MSAKQEYLGFDHGKNKPEQATVSTIRKKVSKRNRFYLLLRFFAKFSVGKYV